MRTIITRTRLLGQESKSKVTRIVTRLLDLDRVNNVTWYVDQLIVNSFHISMLLLYGTIRDNPPPMERSPRATHLGQVCSGIVDESLGWGLGNAEHVQVVPMSFHCTQATWPGIVGDHGVSLNQEWLQLHIQLHHQSRRVVVAASRDRQYCWEYNAREGIHGIPDVIWTIPLGVATWMTVGWFVPG